MKMKFKQYIITDTKKIMADLKTHKDFKKVKVNIELGGTISITYKGKKHYVNAEIEPLKPINYIYKGKDYNIDSLMKEIVK